MDLVRFIADRAMEHLAVVADGTSQTCSVFDPSVNGILTVKPVCPDLGDFSADSIEPTVDRALSIAAFMRGSSSATSVTLSAGYGVPQPANVSPPTITITARRPISSPLRLRSLPMFHPFRDGAPLTMWWSSRPELIQSMWADAGRESVETTVHLHKIRNHEVSPLSLSVSVLDFRG